MPSRFGSRLRRRRVPRTVNVYQRNSGGAETPVYTGLAATHTQLRATEIVGELANVVSEVIDVFWFAPQSDGTLPAITEKHVIRDEADLDVRYDILQVRNEGGQGRRLSVMTRRWRR